MEILAYLTEESFRTLCLVVSRVCHALCPAFKVLISEFRVPCSVPSVVQVYYPRF